MESFTRQELLYIAQALRVSAGASEASAQEPKFFSSQQIFLKAAQSQRELAEKAERMAKMMR